MAHGPRHTARPRHRILFVMTLALLSGCSKPEPPITVREGSVTVLNQTNNDWKNVLITVNDHYRGVVPLLRAEGRANAPLSQFTTGHGQRWIQGTQVRKIEVKGENPDGSPVELSWEIGQRNR